MKKFKLVLNLFLTMLKIGLFTFGGGYAMLALLENEFVSRKKWLEEKEFADMIAIAESTPGPIAINSATYIGYKTAGVLGSTFATIGVCIPSFVIIYVISLFFDAFLSLTYVAYAFNGIKVGVIYMILSAGLKMLKSLPKRPFESIMLILTILVMVGFSIFAIEFSTVFYILIGGVVGIAVYLIGLVKNKEKEQEKEGDKQ